MTSEDLQDQVNPYIYNLTYDYDDFMDARKSNLEEQNKFLKHTSKVLAELLILLPKLDAYTSDQIEDVLVSYLKMQNEIIRIISCYKENI
jgi:hypothetical protein